MRKGLGWFGLRQDSVGGNQRKQRQELRQPNEPEDGEQLCGVGIVLFKAPDNSLFIKVSTLELCTCACTARVRPRLSLRDACLSVVVRCLCPVAASPRHCVAGPGGGVVGLQRRDPAW